MILLVAPVAWTVARVPPRRVLSLAATTALGILILLGPWVMRNYLVRGEFVLISSKAGWNFFMGNNPVPAHTTPWDQKRAIDPEMRARLMKMNEVEGDHYFRGLAWEYIRNNPGETARNVLSRAKNLVWFNEAFGKRSGYSSLLTRVTRPVYMFSWAFLILFTVAGFVMTSRSWRKLILFYGMIGAVSSVILATFFQKRFRAPLEPILILFAAAALSSLWTKLFQRAGPALGGDGGSSPSTRPVRLHWPRCLTAATEFPAWNRPEGADQPQAHFNENVRSTPVVLFPPTASGMTMYFRFLESLSGSELYRIRIILFVLLSLSASSL